MAIDINAWAHLRPHTASFTVERDRHNKGRDNKPKIRTSWPDDSALWKIKKKI